MKELFSLALLNLKSRKLRSFLTIIGIVIGITSVVTLIALGEGLQEAVESQFSSIGTDKLTIQAAGGSYGPPGSDVINPLTKTEAEMIAQVKGVDVVVGRLVKTTRIEYENEVEDQYVISIPVDDQEKVDIIIDARNMNVEEGRFITKGDDSKVLLGANYHNNKFFEAKLRDNILIEGKEFRVVGLLKRQGIPEDYAVFLTEDATRELFNLDEEYDIIIVRVLKGYDVNDVEKRIEKLLRKERDVDEGKEDFTVENPQTALEGVTNILFAIKAVVVGIAFISLLVGGVGIMNTMYTAVLQRTREIGVLKAVGAKNSSILTIFVIESGLIGLVGGIIGIIFGVLISKIVEFTAGVVLDTGLLQAHVSTSLWVGALIFSFIFGCVSGVVPAYMASKLKPVESLRYE